MVWRVTPKVTATRERRGASHFCSGRGRRRILDGQLYAAASRVERALLLRRTYGKDAVRCPKCAAKLRVTATITEPGVVKKILAHLGLPTEPLPRARARDPTGQEGFDFDAA
jgi:hypothetical protein